MSNTVNPLEFLVDLNANPEDAALSLMSNHPANQSNWYFRDSTRHCFEIHIHKMFAETPYPEHVCTEDIFELLRASK